MRLPERLLLAVIVVAVAACGGSAATANLPDTIAGSSLSVGPTQAITQPAAAPSSTLAELPVLTVQATVGGFDGPVDALATDDAVWILDHSGAALVRIDPTTNTVSATVALGSGYASGIGLAAGRLWTFHQTAGEVIGVDPKSAKVVETVRAGQDGDWFTVGDGAAWLVTGGQLVRIDGKTAKVTSRPLGAGCSLDGFAVGGGFAWVASTGGDLCKVDEATGAVVDHGSDVGNGAGLTIVGKQPWLAGVDGGLSIVDPTTLAVSTTVAAPAPGTYLNGKYSIGTPGGESTIVDGDAGAKGGWLRNTGATIGRVTLGATPAITLFAGLPASTFAAGVTTGFGSVWIPNFDSGVVRASLPSS